MKYKYILEVNITRSNEDDMVNNKDASISEKTICEFSNSNPFYAREAAFKKARALKNNFNETKLEDFDTFFRFKAGWNNHCTINIFFISPYSDERFEIHFEDLSTDLGELIHGEKELKPIISALKNEYKILNSPEFSEYRSNVDLLSFSNKDKESSFKVYATELVKNSY